MKPISYLIEKVVDSLPLKASSLLGMSVEELEDASLYGILDRFSNNNLLYITELVCDPVIICGALRIDDPTEILNTVKKLKRLLLKHVETFEVNATCSIIEHEMNSEFLMYYNIEKIPLEEKLEFGLEFACQYLLNNIDNTYDLLHHAESKIGQDKSKQALNKKQK